MTATWRLPDRGEVTIIESLFIPTSDGERLAAQIWLPAGADVRPAPVVLEAIPYRKRDRYRAYGLYWGRILAERGVAYARLDSRGSGDSSGLLADEYLPLEQRDAAEAIAWLAAQSWCNGSLGMRGVSWGGFATLQAAALGPPALKAILPMCAADRRYTDDAHYVGGAFALTGLKWATSMKAVMAGPPDPSTFGPAWMGEWRRRLDAHPAIAARWMSHPAEDDYWRQGSVGFDPAAIRCPVYAVGGLVDPYNDAIPRLLAGLTVPRKGLIGPWRHGYPAPASPGPGLDWAWEELRWWRQWLLGEATGVMDEPMLRVFMPDATAAEVAPGPIPGRWTAESAWPSRAVRDRRLFLGQGRLDEAPATRESLQIGGRDVVGLGKVEWVPFAPSELPREQSPDDARSAMFDTPPLDQPLEILGVAKVRLRLAADRPVAHIAARLCEVDENGRSWLVAWGLLNLTHRFGHHRPEALIPGETYDIDLPLAFAAHRFAAGRRIRLALSGSLWPLVWPAPEIAALTLDLAAASLTLPLRAPPPVEAPMPIGGAAPSTDDPIGWPVIEIAEDECHVRVAETWPPASRVIVDTGVNVSGSGPDIHLSMTSGDPLSCRWLAEQASAWEYAAGTVAIRVTVSVSADAETFVVGEILSARFNGEEVATVDHHTRIPRRFA